MSNKEIFLKSKSELDTIKFGDPLVFHEKPVWDLLCQLHTQGFFKRLHIDTLTEERVEKLPPVQFLEKLYMAESQCNLESFWEYFIEYVEKRDYLAFYWKHVINGGKTRNEIFTENLINVDRLYLYRETLDLVLFIGKLRNLKKLKLCKFKSAEILPLEMLNIEREKLAGAHKVTIHVPDEVFLATKWATKNGITNFRLIKMKRTNSYEWSRYLYAFPMRRVRLPSGLK